MALLLAVFVFDPTNPLIAVAVAGRGSAGTQGGVFRSVDGGINWSRVASAPVGDWSSISVGIRNPLTGQRAYYASQEGQAIYKVR